MSKKPTILDRWDLTIDELTELIDNNPSLRGATLGYIAEIKLRKLWFSGEQITHAIKYDDHDRKKKGDLVVTYKDQSFIIECKSLQTSSIKKVGEVWTGGAQCDASDRRIITLPSGSSINTTCLLVNEFDLLAVSVFGFENEWRFVFAKNSDLPRSRYRKYSAEQREHLLASMVRVTWPPKLPMTAEPFTLLDEIIEDRKHKEPERPIVVTDAEQIEVID